MSWVVLIPADPVADATRVLAIVTAVLVGITALLAASTVALVCVTRRGIREAHEDTQNLILKQANGAELWAKIRLLV